MKEQGVLSGVYRTLVYYEDTDLSGFVYHANYLKYFERAREDIIGIGFLKELFDRQIHFVVAKALLTYKAPATHADDIIIRSQAPYSRSPAIEFTQTAYCQKDGQERLLVKGEITIVVLGPGNRPIRMPDEILQVFADHDINRNI